MMDISYPLILDGATGTELIKKGYTGDISSEQWTLEHPEAIQSIQRSYLQAGSQVLYTPTFGANRVKMEAYGKGSSVYEYNRQLAALSIEVADGNALVAGDIAPSGLNTPPSGDTGFQELCDVYLEQASALNDAGVDLFVIETMSSVADARAAMLAVRSVSDKPVIVSFTCDKNGRTFTGADVAAACITMQGMGASIFGLNCSYGPEDMIPQLRRVADYCTLPLLAKPNAGMPQIIDGKSVYDLPAHDFADYIPEMAEIGVMVYGGCCGTDHSHIKALTEALKKISLHPAKGPSDDVILLSTERHAFSLEKGIKPSTFIPCDEDIEDNADELEDEQIIGIELDSSSDIDELAEAQWSFSKPVCFKADDPVILEEALKVFQGRAAYCGSLSKDSIKDLVTRYGLVIL